MASRAEALPLPLPGWIDLFAHRRAACAVGTVRQLLERHCRHFDVQIDAIQEWPADPADAALDLGHRALARMPAGAQVTARTRLHPFYLTDTRQAGVQC